MAEITAKKVILKSSTGQYVLPYVQPATTDALGTVKPDGVTITAAADGTISAAGGGSSYRPPLLSSIWSDHLLDNISWLRADTFSWHSGDVYSAVYNELLSAWGDWWQTHTAADLELENGVYFARTERGYKICHADEDSSGRLQNAYNTAGAAWIYCIDTENRRFKLPRTKFGFTGLRTAVGDYVAPGLPNITGYASPRKDGYEGSGVSSGAFWLTPDTETAGHQGSERSSGTRINFDASRSNAIYGASNTVQPPATQMYLYFYVGNFTRDAVEQTAGLNAELFNTKVDVNVSNLSVNGKTLISGLGMPSERVVNLTLGASGSTYTAPANGWLHLTKLVTSTQFVSIINQNTGWRFENPASTNTQGISAFAPMRKGDVAYISYNAGGNTLTFQFIYAEGAK